MRIKFWLFIGLFCLFAYSPSAQPNTWKQKQDYGGGPRESAISFSIGNKGYLGMGDNGTGGMYPILWEYDPATNVWTQKASVPGGNVNINGTAFSNGTKAYITTGYPYLHDFWEYNPIANSWTKKANFPGVGRTKASCFSIGNKGYVGLGLDSSGTNYKKDFWQYDSGTDVWTQIADFGGWPRYSASGFSIGNKGYIGVGTDSTGGPSKDFWEYNPTSNVWTQKADVGGVPRSSACGFNIGARGYIGTGSSGSGAQSDFWAYSPKTNTWTQKANVGCPGRTVATSFSISNKGYIGTGGVSGGWMQDFWEYEADSLNKIKGTACADVDQNCARSSGDLSLRNFMIKAEPGPYYGFTNDSGQYTIYVDNSNYVVSPANNNSLWYIPCVPSYNVGFITLSDSSTGNDFLVKADHLCSKLWVDITANSTTYLSNSAAQYAVSYCNKGTATAFNTFIDVTFTDAITPQSSSLPWASVDGNTYRFNTGALTPTQCGSFSIAANINSIANSSLCVSAKILPDTVCITPDSAYDRRQLLLKGLCLQNDTVRFILKNVHQQNITLHGNYLIYENNNVVLINPFNLSPGDSLVVLYPGYGNTIRLETQFLYPPAQHIYPGLQVTIEGCGSNPIYNQTGQLPSNDDDENYEEECIVIVPSGHSFDPNDKTVTPQGITASHFISPNTELEYRINFQNTGTASATYVMIRDTISSMLDVTTFENITSSHPCNISIHESGIIEWVFPNIVLVDSNVNETASHGYVKFKIKQQSNNPYGTIIHNSASIFFDDNDPVITDIAENIVCELPASSFTYTINGNTIHLTNTSSNSSVYLWTYDDGTSDTLSNPFHIYTANSQYNVCLLAVNNCESNISCQSVSISLGLNNFPLLNTVSIQPNPANDFVTVHSSSPVPKEVLTVSIMNVLGKTIREEKTKWGNDISINVQMLSAGIYFLQLTSENERIVKRFVKE